MEVALNPLSANGQCKSIEECIDAISAYVDCCDYCLPALGSKRIKLLYDAHIEVRSLFGNENFLATIANCRGFKDGKDLVRKWYIYTKNRSENLSALDGIEIGLTIDGVRSSVTGTVCKYLHDQVVFWISLSGDALSSAEELILSSDQKTANIRNADNIKSFRKWLPSYQPNTKHRVEPYIAACGEYVSPMPLTDAEAQTLLLTSLSDERGTRWAFHKTTSTYYCFRRTHNEQEIFHGFTECEEKVPNDLRETLRT